MWPLSLVILNVRGGYLDPAGHNTLHAAGLLVYFPLISTREGELPSLWLTCCGAIRQQPEQEFMPPPPVVVDEHQEAASNPSVQAAAVIAPAPLPPPPPFTSLVINGLCQSSWVIGRTSSPVKRLISTLLCGWLKAAINDVMGSARRFVFPPAAYHHRWHSVIRVRWLY